MINPWCAEKSEREHIPKERLCKIAVETFGDSISPAKIRYLVSEEFKDQKQSARRKPKELSKEQKISKVMQLKNRLKLETSELVDGLVNPIYQSVKLLQDN